MKLSAELKIILNGLRNEAEVLNKKEGVTIEEVQNKSNEIKLAKAKLDSQLQIEADEEAEQNAAVKVPVAGATEPAIGGGTKVNKLVFAKAIIGSATAEEMSQITNLVLEGDRTKGGVAIPSDIVTEIKVYQDATRMFDIRPYITVEPVSTLKGSRPYAVNEPQAQGFASVDEGADIQALYEPTFDELAYLVRKYAGYIPLTNELLEDSAANIYAYIVKWIAENELNTYVYQTLHGTGVKSSQGIITEATTPTTGALLTRTEEITTVFATDIALIKKFKTTFNVDLETVTGDNIKIFTNSDGYDHLDGLTDANGKFYLKEDVTVKSGFTFLGREIIKLPKKFLANITADINTLVPFIIGDLKQLYTMYDRAQMSVATTNVGGDTWRNDTTELKGIFRFDGKIQPANIQAVKILLIKLV